LRTKGEADLIKLRMTIESFTLMRPVEVYASLPHGILCGRAPYRALWMLHSAMKGGEMFFESRAVLELAERENLALIAPCLGLGYFTNSAHEAQADFLKEEFLTAMRRSLPVSEKRADNFVLGVSMGGFGAFRWALDAPDTFAGAAAVSSLLDPRIPLDERAMKDRKQRALILMFTKVMRSRLLTAEGEVTPEADLRAMLLAGKRAGLLPKLALYHGEQDYFALNSSAAFHDFCVGEGIAIVRHTAPGAHDFAYWDQTLPEAMEWLLA
jgi:S-formylglutathione hydrolase FrmB